MLQAKRHASREHLTQHDTLLLLPAGNMELLQGLGLQSLRYSMDCISSTAAGAGLCAPVDAGAAPASSCL